MSFEPPTPQMFSFNSPAGMCLACAGLGEVFSFVPHRLIPDDRKSIKQGCVELLGKWADFGRWRRHIYQGVADTIERLQKLPEGHLLETPWSELSPDHRQLWLYGTGEQHITFTWRGGSSPMKYGGKFAGIIAELDERYRNLKADNKRTAFEQYMDHVHCAACRGARLNEVSRNYKLATRASGFVPALLSLPEVNNLSIDRAALFFSELELDPTGQVIAEQLQKEIQQRLGFLINVGLSYLTLSRTAPTLSGGETQRIRLAGQIGAGLIGVLYILDEPSIGLHPRDNDRLIATLKRLRDLGNTVIVVEHDEDTMRAADHLIDFGPGPGIHGGHVVVTGPPAELMRSPDSVTGQFLSGRRKIAIPARRRPVDRQRMLRIVGARQNNLKNITAEIPLGLLVCITGVSGSGKSSLINDILIESLNVQLNHGHGEPADFDRLEGVEHLDKMIAIDQSPIGRTPRSNPGTYIKLFDAIRQLYAQLPESKKRGFAPGRFSFNVSGGRCEACEGNGSNRLEMDFLADIWVTCPVCQGARFNRETLQVRYRDKSIDQVLRMTVEEALTFFENIPKIQEKLQTLHDVGLDYLQIGQPSPTLSGGEAQRIKLARELVKRSTGRTLYLLDEPTTGLHFADIDLLLKVLHRFADAGNTVVVVEHNLDVIKTADWVIDLGPEGGAAGGQMVCAGTPEQVADSPTSYTGRALARVFSSQKPTPPTRRRKSSASSAPRQETEITVQGARQHNLKDVHAVIPRDQFNVFCGPSGSGKSSLAMDTIYAEGQRRYVESLSSYARQFVNQMEKPKVDHIDGLSPAIAIEQKNFGSTPRSTVGTITEIYDYFRVLFARLGTPFCPDCDVPIGTQTAEQIADKIAQRFAGQRVLLLAPWTIDQADELDSLGETLRAQGYLRVRINGRLYSVDALPPFNRLGTHQIEVVMDRLDIKSESLSRLRGSVESALS
ncbi:MAG TPA: excinuclease ABC subunit UvrA, partial [Pirellulaceae bacterium]|nr:excinuclease ABC subunit UvrA [Pirellulaceae bacterium]